MAAIDGIRTRLFEMGIETPDDTYLRRLGGGQWARAQGRWSWALYSPTNFHITLGSQYPATELLKCPDWEIDTQRRGEPDRSIWPCDNCQREGITRHEKGSTP